MIASWANLVLAEVYLEEGELDKCERELEMLEAADAKSDFFLLGNIQRIRGLLALKYGDTQLAVHHFSRGLTTFEAAEDLYHRALLHYLIGKTISEDQPQKAVKHLTPAGEIFRNLGIAPRAATICIYGISSRYLKDETNF